MNNQVTTVYGRDENGDYTVVVRQMLCSTGTKSYPSDVGDWVLNGRTARWCYFPRWGGHAQYWTRINSSIAFHSVIYNSVNTMDLSVSSYKNLGTRVSHGCIRLTVADAKWIYDNVGEGTVVTIREDLPDDPELRASLELPPLDYSRMLPEETPEPTATPTYISGAMPPMPLEQMKKNSSGEDVWWLQAKLKELGYYGGTVTGTYLGGTVDAVKAFQKAVGLKADGIAGAATLEKLYEQELATPTPIPTPSPTPEVIATPVATPTPTPAPATDEATHAPAVPGGGNYRCGRGKQRNGRGRITSLICKKPLSEWRAFLKAGHFFSMHWIPGNAPAWEAPAQRLRHNEAASRYPGYAACFDR